MDDVVRLGSRTWLRPTRTSDLRVTWHHDDDLVVITLWRGDECAGSAPLSIPDAGSLTTFLVAHLGEHAARAGQQERPDVVSPRPS